MCQCALKDETDKLDNTQRHEFVCGRVNAIISVVLTVSVKVYHRTFFRTYFIKNRI